MIKQLIYLFFLLFPAFEKAMATACSFFLPERTSSPMFAPITFLLEPFFSGIKPPTQSTFSMLIGLNCLELHIVSSLNCFLFSQAQAN